MGLYAAAYSQIPRIRVHTVFPTTMHTQSCADEDAVKSDLIKSFEEDDQIPESEKCARRAIKGLEAGQELVPTSIIIRLVMSSVMVHQRWLLKRLGENNSRVFENGRHGINSLGYGCEGDEGGEVSTAQAACT